MPRHNREKQTRRSNIGKSNILHDRRCTPDQVTCLVTRPLSSPLCSSHVERCGSHMLAWSTLLGKDSGIRQAGREWCGGRSKVTADLFAQFISPIDSEGSP